MHESLKTLDPELAEDVRELLEGHARKHRPLPIDSRTRVVRGQPEADETDPDANDVEKVVDAIRSNPWHYSPASLA